MAEVSTRRALDQAYDALATLRFRLIERGGVRHDGLDATAERIRGLKPELEAEAGRTA